MADPAINTRYRPTKSQYKGGAEEMYITYDLEQRIRSGGHAAYPKVKRVYISGIVKDWRVGMFKKKSGRSVYGVQVEYERDRGSYHRKGFTAQRGKTTYQVSPTPVKAASLRITKIIEIPDRAKNVSFYTEAEKLPEHYLDALQDVR